ncbi:hypothetical protein PISMIDRAFT_19402 [Pisolithus microcarpus 441]|uniref:F-box domain-containing protein n=1 Tax=Pisolithus microcarpus 441 TaxID=765257 RepID=A0A0C9YCH5_9AGAM|nr:hypothetical protein PISMIDRAFT_19402 [Pisolithus microcarpus 441]
MPSMGLVLSHYAGVLVSPRKRQDDNMAAREGCPIPCDLARTVQVQGQDFTLGSPPNISHMTSLVEVTQKRKFCEDQDSALGPPLKISRGTSLTIQTSAVNIQPISSAPLVIPSRKRKASEDQDLVLGRPAKIPRIPSLVDPANLPPRGSSCFIWRLPNELFGHIATLLPRSSLLALTQTCQLLREITAPHYFALLGLNTAQSNYLFLDDDGCTLRFQTPSSRSSSPLPSLRSFCNFFFYLGNMDGGKLPSYKVSFHFTFHPYARVKPSAHEIVMAALYDDTYDERFIPSSSAISPSSFAIPPSSFAISPSLFVISDSGTASDGGRLPSYKFSRQYRFHPYARIKPSAREVVMAASYTA